MGDTNKETHVSNEYRSETDVCTRNLAKEHENEEDEEFSENNSEINDSIKSKISKGKTEEDVIISILENFLAQSNPRSYFSIDTYEKDILSVGNKNKKTSKRKMETL